MFREKAVALAARRFVVVVTPEKLVDRLGTTFPTPLEVVPFTVRAVTRAVELAYPGVSVRRRNAGGAPYVTDNGNAVLDCAFGAIADPAALDRALRDIHGVVATGLFPHGMTSAVLVGYPDGVRAL
jgi:ribose 5-phosphate isomerase A